MLKSKAGLKFQLDWIRQRVYSELHSDFTIYLTYFLKSFVHPFPITFVIL